MVTSERYVLFENEQWLLSPLVKELYTRLRNINSSRAYQGPTYFTFNGNRLIEIPIVK